MSEPVPGTDGGRAPARVAVRVADIAGGVALAAMLATPFSPRGGRMRRVLAWATVAAGATRSVAVDVERAGGTRAALVRAGATNLLVASIGGAVESVGVRTGRPFGRYAYTGVLRPTLAGVPVLVPMAWIAMSGPAHGMAGAIVPDVSSATGGARPLERIVLGSGALAAWDLFLDPQMTAEGYWQWDRPGRYRGIPAANFLGWLGVGVLIMSVRELLLGDRSAGQDADDRHLVTYGVVGALETIAFATFFRDRLVATVGGLPMLTATIAAVRRSRG